LRHSYEAEEKVAAKFVGRVHLQKNVHENFETAKVNILKLNKNCYYEEGVGAIERKE
jgi:hypothetical protein